MSSAGSSLTAKLVLTGDNKGIVSAAEGTVVALDAVKRTAQEAGTAAAAASGEFSASAAALRGQAEAATLSNTAIAAGAEAKAAEVVRLTQMAAAGDAVVGRVRAMSAAHAEYNATVAQGRGLLAAQIISQEQFAELVAASSAKLALARTAADAGTAATVTELEAVQALSLGLRSLSVDTEASTVAADKLAYSLGHLAGVPRELRSRLKAGMDAIPELLSAYPIEAAGGAIALALGVVIAAEQSYEASIGKVDVAVQAHGLTLGGVSKQYLDLGHNIADAAKVSEQSARGMEQSFLDAHLSPELWNEVAAMSRDYAAVLGTDVPQAAQKAAENLSRPYEWAVKLTEQYGLFDEATLQQIRSLEQSGAMQAAQQLVTQAWAERIKNAAEQTSGWAKAWDAVSTSVSNTWDHLGKFLFGASPQDQLVNLQQQLQGFEAAAEKENTHYYDAAIANLRKMISDIEAKLPKDDGLEARNREALGIQNIADQYDPYSARIGQNVDQRMLILAARAHGTIDAAEAQKLLNENDQQYTRILEEQTKAELSLNDEAKRHYDHIKDLIANAPEVISQGNLEAQTAVGRAEAYRQGASAYEAFNDQQEVAKATLPYITELNYAHGASYEKLKKIIAEVTAEKQKQLTADKALAAMQDIDQQVGSASGYMSNALAGAWLAQGRKKLDEWYETQSAGIATAGDDWEAYQNKLDLLMGQKLVSLYDQDLRNRTDWASGVIRANQDVLRSTQDWASKSEAFVTGWDRASEDAFVNVAKSGKANIGDLTNFVEEQFLRMAYESRIAGSMNAIGGSILDGIGNLLGISSGGVDSVSVTGKPKNLSAGSSFWDQITTGIHHDGRSVGDASSYRQIPVWAFYGAETRHGGGPVFGPDEIPIVAKRREIVLTEEQQNRSDHVIDAWDDALSAALQRPMVMQVPPSAYHGGDVLVNIQNAPGIASTKRETTNTQGQRQVDIINELADKVDNTLADRHMRGGTQFGSALAQTFGVDHRVVR